MGEVIVKSNVFLSGIQREELNYVWADVKDYLQQALDKAAGEYDLVDVWRLLDDRKAQLWVLYEEPDVILGACVTEIVEYPRKKVVNLWLAAGTAMDIWFEHMSFLEAWARRNNAQSVRWMGRKGFEKLSAPHGFKTKYIVIEKELGG